MTRTLKLHSEPFLQGKFESSSLNVLFVFQVNCPGCFLYALPVVNRLHAEYSDRVSFFGLSTAFEDFDRNTRENTESFLEAGEMTCETLEAFEAKGIRRYPEPPTFPVAFMRGSSCIHPGLANNSTAGAWLATIHAPTPLAHAPTNLLDNRTGTSGDQYGLSAQRGPSL